MSIRANSQLMSYFRRTYWSRLWRGALLLLGGSAYWGAVLIAYYRLHQIIMERMHSTLEQICRLSYTYTISIYSQHLLE